LIILAIHAIVASTVLQKWLSKSAPKHTDITPDIEPRTSWLQKRGGPTIIAFKTIRLLVIGALLSLTLLTSVPSGWQWYNYVLVSSLVKATAPPFALAI
jgi:pheromone shutdown protein TraB